MLNRNGSKCNNIEIVFNVNLKCFQMWTCNAFKCEVEMLPNGFNVVLKWFKC